ncbi:MAG: WYL domain-containing protein, partial [Oscillospiraceae bacterium]|nr:WYL domain-containing protein [Oscillospiraceae bacterium]
MNSYCREGISTKPKLLVDAVQSSRLITVKKSNELIKKLSKLTSKTQSKHLNRQVHIKGRAKALNESVYYTIDAIHDAINTSKKISFRYFSYDIKKNRIYYRLDKPFIRTPVALCWNDDNYYLISYSPKFDIPFATFRVDRMTEVEVLEDKGDKYDKSQFNVTEYIKQNFGMFTGEVLKAKLSFDESLVNVVLDQFGSETYMVGSGDGRFVINANVSATSIFLGWMFKFG